MIALLDDAIRLRKSRRQVTAFVRHPQPHVAPQRRMDGRGLCLQREQRVEDRR